MRDKQRLWMLFAPVMAAAATPGPTTPPSPSEFRPVASEVRFLSVGGLDVAPGPPSDVPSWGDGYGTAIHPLCSSSISPASFSLTNYQSAYRDQMWGPQRRLEDFAQRGTWLHGSSLSSLGHFISGVGMTRTTAEAVDINTPKRVVGVLTQGVTTVGTSTSTAAFLVQGVLSKTFTTTRDVGTTDEESHHDFDESAGLDETSSQYDKLRHNQIGSMQGGEYHTFFGDPIARELVADGGQLQWPADARNINYQEDQLWDFAPVIAKKAIGKRSVASVGNATVQNAYGLRSTMVASRPDSSFWGGFIGGQYYEAIGSRAVTIGAGFFRNYDQVCNPPDDSQGDGFVGWGERNGSVIRDQVMLEVREPTDGWAGGQSVPVTIGARYGVTIGDMDPYSGGGAPPSAPGLIRAQLNRSMPGGGLPSANPSHISKERVASIRANAGAYVGGTIHLRDMMHLAPRREPPDLSRLLADCQDTKDYYRLAGMMYFDLTENCLMFSVPTAIGSIDPQVTYVWKRIELSDVTTNSDFVPIWTPMAGDLTAALESTEDEISDGSSPFIPLRIRPLVGAYTRETISNGASGAEEVISILDPSQLELLLEGWGDVTTPLAENIGSDLRLYWRRPAIGRDSFGETPWIRADLDKVVPGVTTDRRYQVVSLGGGSGVYPDYDSPTHSRDGNHPVRGFPIEFMLIDLLSDRTAGTSLRYSFVGESRQAIPEDIADILVGAKNPDPVDAIGNPCNYKPGADCNINTTALLYSQSAGYDNKNYFFDRRPVAVLQATTQSETTYQ